MISKFLQILGLQPQSFSWSLEQFIHTVGQNNFGNKIPFLFQVILILLQNRQQQHTKFKWSLFNVKTKSNSCCKEANILEKRLTIYEYLLNYCIVQTDGEKVWMWLTKGEGKKEGRQNRVAQDIWSLVHNQVSLASTSLLGSLENYITMRSKNIWSQILISTILWFLCNILE